MHSTTRSSRPSGHINRSGHPRRPALFPSLPLSLSLSLSLTLSLTLSLFLPLLLSSCGGDSSSPVTPPPPTALSQITLGPDGGLWQHDDFQLLVPAGQLPAGTTLSLFAEDQDSTQPDAQVAAVYRIEGLPLGLDRDIPLRLRHQAAGGDSLYAMVGQTGYVPSLGRQELTWRMVACADSAGWALCDLPLSGPSIAGPSPAGRKNASTRAAATATTSAALASAGPDKDDAPPLRITVVNGVGSALSSQGRFSITFRPSQMSDLEIQLLAQELENTLDLYQFMGYEQAGFTAWPIQVNVQPLAYGGFWCPDPRSLGGSLTLNPNAAGDVIELPRIVGHELFHFCQYFYDPRSVLERGASGPVHRWLDEATAVHMENYFSSQEGYPSAARLGHELELLNGLLSPREGLTWGEHGYGVSSLIRYLFLHEPSADNFIQSTYEAVAAGTHAAAALQAATTIDIAGQWPRILEDLLRGHIYSDVTWPVIQTQPRPTLLTVATAADTTGTLTRTMPDLSGRLATLNLDNADWSSLHRLVLWTEQADCGVSVLGVKADGLRELVDHGTGSLTLWDPAMLQNLYDQLLVLVSNPRFQGPDYDGERSVTLQARVRTAAPVYTYPRLSFHLQCDAFWNDDSSTINQEINIWNVDGDFTDGHFTAAWDSTIDDGAVRFTGMLDVRVDAGFSQVDSWSARMEIWHFDDTGVRYQASGGAVPATNHSLLSFSAWLEGTETCGALDSVDLLEVNNVGSRSLVSHDCRSTSYVKFFFENPILPANSGDEAP